MGKSSFVVYIKEQQSAEKAETKYKCASEFWRNVETAPNPWKSWGARNVVAMDWAWNGAVYRNGEDTLIIPQPISANSAVQAG